MPRLIPGQHIHIVGIGGFGMSALARVLLQQGYYVSGSDRRPNALTQALEQEGAVIFKSEDAQNVIGAEMVLSTSAAPANHVELAMARALNIPIYKRSDVIADIMSGQVSIAVAGTHGKTTTTSMITHILIETLQNPSYIIGGILRNSGHNAGVGTGKAFVIEADEYDFMFLGLRPKVAVVNNIEYDHPDFFKTPNELVRAFNQFVDRLPTDGLLVACADDPTAAILAQNRLVAGWPVTTYGVHNPQANWRALNLRIDDRYQTVFEVQRDGQLLGTASLIIPGEFNVLNALAALIVADQQGVPFPDAARALAAFQGAGRRFQARGEVGGVLVIDDYAHHPTAIRVTLQAAKERFKTRQIWAVWQPHTFSRTQALWDGYVSAFEAADHVLLTDIYAAREEPVPGVTSAELAGAIAHPSVQHTPGLDDAVDYLLGHVEPPAAILIMSAGDAPLIGVNYLKLRQERLDGPAESPAG
ncbi:MAG: UDP-N-acetylmuramate--L-alanine ligase [Anaerolineae bacterium]|nr:UDP-N-acetylmuramate--L-alanine ligase [Anaerolineae bacterium]